VSKHQVYWRREDEIDKDLCIFKPGNAVKCQLLTSLLFPTKCIWRVGTQDRSRNGEQEGEIFRLPSGPVNTTKIARCHESRQVSFRGIVFVVLC